MRFRIPDWLIYITIVFLIYIHAIRGQDRIITPPPPPDLGPLLPSASPQDKSIILKIQNPASGIGTAFAINNKGAWLTARHVVDSCDRIGLRVAGNQSIKVDAQISTQADLAILTTKWRRPPLATDLTSNRRIGEYGYFFGFPQGKPGEVVGELLARNRMIVRGRYRTKEAILAWTEVGRTTGLFGSLGGLSGGPVLDKDGEVIGIVAAESPRRGRIYSVAPSSLLNVLGRDNGAARQAISSETYGLQADQMRRDRRIAQVICIVS